MKVRINHAIEIDDIPNKLSEMVSEIRLQIQDAEKAASQAEAIAYLSNNSVLKYQLLTESLAEIKTQATEAAQSIDDMVSMLGGYIGILDPKPEPAAPLPVAEPPVHHSFREDLDLQGPDVPDYNKVPASDATTGTSS